MNCTCNSAEESFELTAEWVEALVSMVQALATLSVAAVGYAYAGRTHLQEEKVAPYADPPPSQIALAFKRILAGLGVDLRDPAHLAGLRSAEDATYLRALYG